MKYLMMIILISSCSGAKNEKQNSSKILDDKIGTFQDMFKEIDE